MLPRNLPHVQPVNYCRGEETEACLDSFPKEKKPNKTFTANMERKEREKKELKQWLDSFLATSGSEYKV